MNPSSLDGDILGSILQNIWASGASSETLGGFVRLQVGVSHPALSDSAFGLVLHNLVAAHAGPKVLGQFVLRELGLNGLEHGLEPNRQSVQEPRADADSEGSNIRAVVKNVLQMDFGMRAKKPVRTTTQVKVALRGKPTTMSINAKVVEAFLARFGRKALNQLARSVDSLERSDGVPRSTRVEMAMEIALADDGGGQANQAHGLTVIKGGAR